MRVLLFTISIIHFSCSGQADHDPMLKKYEQQAERITIIRDSWGIPHIYGKTDADAVFGLMYTQCEESFERVERAYLEKLGRVSEIEGESRLYEDLLARMLYDTSKAINDYNKSPEWLKAICIAFADGVNYYLHKNPGKAMLIHHFEPWYPLLFTDGAYVAMHTGGLSLSDIKTMYALPGDRSSSFQTQSNESTGSNAFAIGPSKTISKNTMLYINPHVSFHFRMEAHMVSEEGLNAYGAITWGQFFIYQGFNEHCGWMHTSTMADAADLFIETMTIKDDVPYYMYGNQSKKPVQKQHSFRYKKNNDVLVHSVLGYYTDHGPVLGRRKENWLSLKSVTHSLDGLVQSWQRTKTSGLEEFKKTMELRANATTNTMYADDKGNIAYWHGNFIPKRNTGFNYAEPVSGLKKETDWQGIHALDELIHIINPKQGFIQNCNSTPFSVSGINTLNKNDYPAYMAPDGENFRSQLAIRELEKENQYSLEKMIALGYNNYLAAFDSLLPPLFNAYDALKTTDPLHEQLKEPIHLLRTWDKRFSLRSEATTLAVFWGYRIIYRFYNSNDTEENDQLKLFAFYARTTPPDARLNLLTDAVTGIGERFGNWRQPWGEVNRYQRKTGGLNDDYSDDHESHPVPFASSVFGCLAAYETTWSGGRKAYGFAGNSFVAAVEFGPRVKAKAIAPGGQSFDPKSKHFSDQTNLFIEGKFRDVFFYKEDVEKNKERTYHPGK